jgi:3-oxoacyl-[acyl-carrier protein] reductase
MSVSPNIAVGLSLEGRVAVVTGAAKGIGQQTAVTLGAAGATVVLADLDKDGLEETASEIDRAVVVPTDVSIRSDVDTLALEAIRANGRIDVWANVAGIIRTATIQELTENDLDAVISVNLKGVVWGCAAAARVMSDAGRGSIINVASSGGETPAPSLAAYGMTKAAVIQLTRIVAAELAPSGVRVNSVAPGLVETPMTARHWTRPDGTVDEQLRVETLGRLGRSPLGIIGTPQDIAWAILYLASDISRFTTGQVMRVNGGIHMA